MTNMVTQKIQFQFLALPAESQISACLCVSQLAPEHGDFQFIDWGRCGNLRARTYILCASYK